MKFIAKCNSVRQEVEYAMGCSAQKSSMSISSTVLLDLKGDSLSVRATDGKNAYKGVVSVEPIEPGSTAVFCDKLLAVLKNMPEGNLEFAEECGKLTIRPTEGKGKIKVNLKTMDGSKFPKEENCPDGEWFTLPQKTFVSLMDKTMFAVADKSTKPFLTGVYLDHRDSELRMVATDGRRMAYAWDDVEQGLPDFTPAVLPVKFLSLVKSISSGEGIFDFAVHEGSVFAKVGSREVRSSVIAGSYPNYEKVIPKEFNSTATLQTAELDKAITLNSVMVETKSNRVFLGFDDGSVTVYGENNEYGDCRQMLHCDTNVQKCEMSFNCALLLPSVKKVDTKDIVVGVNSPGAAMGIMPSEGGKYIFVLMPMQG